MNSRINYECKFSLNDKVKVVKGFPKGKSGRIVSVSPATLETPLTAYKISLGLFRGFIYVAEDDLIKE